MSVEKKINAHNIRFTEACFTMHVDASIKDKKELHESHTLERLNKILDGIPYWYCIAGKEICPNTGAFHLQCYIQFKNQVRLSKIKKIDNQSHWENARGSFEENFKYCSKDKNYIEWGTPKKSEQGKRNDLINLCDDIKKGKKKKDIIDEYTTLYVKNHNGIDKLMDFYAKDRNEPPTFIWLFGKAGVGKSKYIFDKFDNDNIYSKSAGKWWDGYHQQDVILIDDFDKETYEFRELLKLCDRYKYSGQVKGGFVKINSPYIFITCEFPPSYFWSGNTLIQVLRRADRIIYLGEDPKNIKVWIIERKLANAKTVGKELKFFVEKDEDEDAEENDIFK